LARVRIPPATRVCRKHITFYEQLDGLLGTEGALAVALAMRDASYLVHVTEDDGAIALSQTDGFPAAELGYVLRAAESLQHDADLLFG
jgi:hypothetical protein